MGRKKIEEKDKKVKRSISISPELIEILKSECVNISSLLNKLLKEYIENGKEINNKRIH